MAVAWASVACANAQPVAPSSSAARDPVLLALMDEHYDAAMREDPLFASRRGDERFNDQLRDESPAAHAERLDAARDRLNRLEALLAGDAARRFSRQDTVDAGLLRHELRLAVDGARFRGEQTPVTRANGPQIWLPQMGDDLPFRTEKHYADFATRLEKVAGLIDQYIAQMRLGLAAGRVPPRVVIEGAEAQCRALSGPEVEADPTRSPFYKPFLGRPAGDAHAARAREAVAAGIVPAYRRLAAFLGEEYIPRCRETLGAAQGVDGPESYEFALRMHTTTALRAEEVHEIGHAEVARIRAEMLATIARSDFPRKGELAGDELLAAFIAYLRTDQRFYHPTPEALLAGYRDICKRIDAELPQLFGRLPRLTYGVREMPAFMAPTSPTGYYYTGSLKTGLPGWFVANTYRLDQRPKYEMIALAIHEAVPGHHLQIALSLEMEGQHPFRELLGFTAFVEGWALYSERLGLEMAGGDGGRTHRGLYEDPYDDFGRLTYEMWRACRLVVDTGIHGAFEGSAWSRQRAIDFMLKNTALSRVNIEREVDRYIGWPGQACGYMIGRLRILDIRAKAEAALGDRFDVRSFHDAVLGSGAVPLKVLEEQVRGWVESRRAP